MENSFPFERPFIKLFLPKQILIIQLKMEKKMSLNFGACFPLHTPWEDYEEFTTWLVLTASAFNTWFATTCNLPLPAICHIQHYCDFIMTYHRYWISFRSTGWEAVKNSLVDHLLRRYARQELRTDKEEKSTAREENPRSFQQAKDKGQGVKQDKKLHTFVQKLSFAIVSSDYILAMFTCRN